MFFLLCFFPRLFITPPRGGRRENQLQRMPKKESQIAPLKKNTGYMATFSNAATCLQHYVHAKHFKCLFCGWGERRRRSRKCISRGRVDEITCQYMCCCCWVEREEKRRKGLHVPFSCPPSSAFLQKKEKKKGAKMQMTPWHVPPPLPHIHSTGNSDPIFLFASLPGKRKKRETVSFLLLGTTAEYFPQKSERKKVCLVTAALLLCDLKKSTKVAISPKKASFLQHSAL